MGRVLCGVVCFTLPFKMTGTSLSSIDFFLLRYYFLSCYSAVGRQYLMTGIGQDLSLGSRCNHKGIVMHLIMHAIGFWHEQSRPDRNLYVEVLWENIQDGKFRGRE